MDKLFFFYSGDIQIASSLKLEGNFECPILLSCFYCKQTLKLLVIFPLVLFCHLSILIADQNMSFHGQIGRVIDQFSIQLAKQSVCQSYSRKKSKQGVGDKKFPWVLKKEHVEISGLNEKGSGISREDLERIMWNFRRSWVLALEFPRGVTQFCRMSRG